MAWSKRPRPRRLKYGAEHRAARAAALARYSPADPCCRCGQPLGANTTAIHLDHADDGRTYRGLAHARCNVRAGARRGAQLVNAARSRSSTTTTRATSLRW